MAKTFKKRTQPTPTALGGFELRCVGDEDAIKGGIDFFFEDSGGSQVRGERVEVDTLPQAAQDALEAFRAAVWDQAATDNPSYNATPKADRRAAAEAARAAAEAEAARIAAEEAAAQEAQPAEPEVG